MRPIALTMLLEMARDRLVHLALMGSCALILFSSVLASLTLGFTYRILTDISITVLGAGTIVSAILVGAHSFGRELDRRITHTVLARPISRTKYLGGKLLGLGLGLIAIVIVQGLVAGATIAAFSDGGIPYTSAEFVGTLAFVWLRALLVGGLALALTTIASPTVAMLSSLAIAAAGHLSRDFSNLAATSDDVGTRVLAKIIFHVLPDLSSLDTLGQLVHGDPILNQQFVLSACYGLAWLGVVFWIGSWVFTRRDLS